jgi:hypothetical protein
LRSLLKKLKKELEKHLLNFKGEEKHHRLKIEEIKGKLIEKLLRKRHLKK